MAWVTSFVLVRTKLVVQAKNRADAEALARREQAERWQRDYERGLEERFGADNAQRILVKEIWQGATAEMVLEMLGEPADKARRVFKTKTTETWKYEPFGKNRYRVKITFENDVCVGWDKP
jgi:hypothetical protein